MPEPSKLKILGRTIRKGVPFTVYFTAEQTKALAEICRDRRVSKATVVRFAVERLFEQIRTGQLDLPLGL
jgi:hypothetical protein